MIIGTIALLSLLLFGGGDGGIDILGELQAQREDVGEVVADAPRAQEAERTLDAMISEFEGLAADVAAQRQAVLAFDLRYDVTEADYREAFESLISAWSAHEHRLTELRSDLRETTTREEWDALHRNLRKKVDELTGE